MGQVYFLDADEDVEENGNEVSPEEGEGPLLGSRSVQITIYGRYLSRIMICIMSKVLLMKGIYYDAHLPTFSPRKSVSSCTRDPWVRCQGMLIEIFYFVLQGSEG